MGARGVRTGYGRERGTRRGCFGVLATVTAVRVHSTPGRACKITPSSICEERSLITITSAYTSSFNIVVRRVFGGLGAQCSAVVGGAEDGASARCRVPCVV
eukprot:scaffold812_cov126-Isochrysis_galbana.AAC.6